MTPPPKGMVYPGYVKIQPWGVWTLRNCDSIRLEIERTGTLLWDGAFREVISVADRLGKAKACVDIGANIGDSTRWFLDAGFRTYAFEPQPEAFLCLLRNCPEAECFNFPVGNGERVSMVRPGDDRGNVGGISVRPDPAGHEAVRLDDLTFGEQVGILKIDVEGWEPNVLAGSTRFIKEHNPMVAIEFNRVGLAQCGFGFEDILKYFQGWRWVETYRWGVDMWDVVYYKE